MDQGAMLVNLQKEINGLKEDWEKIVANYKNRISILELEIEELVKTKDIAIEWALNKMKNEMKSTGEKSKEALEEINRLKKENENKDKWIESLRIKIDEVVNNEHKEKQRADNAEMHLH